MTRVSRYALNKELEKEVFLLFWSSIAQLKSANTVSSFFADLLSDTEELMLAKRFTVAVLLKRGKKPVDISRILNISFSTIRSVSEWLAHANPSTLHVIDHIQTFQDLGALFDAIEALFDRLPPRRGTNWTPAGKQKWVRKFNRAVRSSLR